MTKRLIAFALLAATTASAALSAPVSQPDGPAVSDPPVSYMVRKGDNLYDLALHYMRRLADYRIVQKLNHVRDPRRLPIAHTLLIPRALLRSDPL